MKFSLNNFFGNKNKNFNNGKIDLQMALRDKKTKEKALQIILKLVNQTKSLTAKDMGDWKDAWQIAINAENPHRFELYNIYDDVAIDLHLTGAINNRKLALMQKAFKIVNTKTKEENPDLTELFKAAWFKEFINLSLDSIFYGYSLIQFGDVITEPKLGFTDVNLVPRSHVVPEFGVLIREVTDDTKKGFSYTTGSIANWCIGVGKKNDLGLLLKLATEAIPKKNMLAFWDIFGEKFGVPMIVGKTDTRDKKEVTEMENMLSSLSSDAWALFHDGTEIEIKESANKDSFQVFDKRVDRANSEMSKAVDGQTMTMDDGSSQSQAEVHYKVSETIASADADFIKNVVNDKLFPFLERHGFNLTGYSFDFDDTHEYSPDEMKNIETMLLQYYEIDEKYFIDKYNIGITGKRNTATPAINIETEKKKSNNKIDIKIPVFLNSFSEEFINANISSEDNQKLTDDLIRYVWDNPESTFSWDYYNALNSLFQKAISKGWKETGVKNKFTINYDSEDTVTKQMMELNLFRFSSGKNLAAVSELNQLLPKAKSFAKFKKAAYKNKLIKGLNSQYLNTEYNFAYSVSQNAANYHRMLKNKDLYPTWIYRTAGDERVREAHKKLNGMKFKADDPAFSSIAPPNGWGCRCYLEPSTEVPENYSTKEDAINKLKDSEIDKYGKSEWDRMKQGKFNINRAKINTIYDEDKMYVKNELTSKLTYKAQGLPDFAEIDKSKFANKTVKERTKEFAEKWHENNADKLFDYNKRKLIFTEKTLKAHLTEDKYIKKGIDGRQNSIELIPEIITKPDEVYFFEDGRNNNKKLRYIKYYQKFTMNVVCDINDTKGTILNSWYNLDVNKIDKYLRQGILIKRASNY